MNQDAPPQFAGKTPLQAHSLAEVHLYLMVRMCDCCREGPLHGATSLREPDRGRSLVTIQAKCSRCREESWFLFEIPEVPEPPTGQPQGVRRINPTDEASKILDVANWVTLAQIMLNAAERAADRGEARELRCDAGECLDEALRFFGPESDLPPPEAFFSDRTRQRLRDRPELYIRQTLIARRRALPSRIVMPGGSEPGETSARRPWWRLRR